MSGLLLTVVAACCTILQGQCPLAADSRRDRGESCSISAAFLQHFCSLDSDAALEGITNYVKMSDINNRDDKVETKFLKKSRKKL